MSNLCLKGEEKVVFKLRSLYSSFGYRPYKMRRFEEYDLYAGNKDFLVSGNIITFTDTDGKLMALKPDVTLSIVRSVRETGKTVARISYDENVYRVSGSSGTFREIMQAGIECIGDVGLVEMSEVALLAQMSLSAISASGVLTISHMGIVQSLLSSVPEALQRQAMAALSARNISLLSKLASDNPEYKESLNRLSVLLTLTGGTDEVFRKLASLGADASSMEELKQIVSVLDPRKTRIDFSLLDGMKYYNGITFRGFVEGVPVPVISGGQYDRLMKRMKKNCRAIGFAVYLDALERILEEVPEYDVDTVLLYKDSDDVTSVLSQAAKLREKGLSVATMKEIPANLRYRRAVQAGGDCNA